MGKLNQVSGKDAIKALEKLGFEVVKQEGSHVKMRKVTPNGIRQCQVVTHDTIAIGTLLSILRQAGITKKEFQDSL